MRPSTMGRFGAAVAVWPLLATLIGGTSARAAPPGLLRVVSSPAVTTQILVDGQIADTWGLNWLKEPPGSHGVCFIHVEGWTEPPCQTVTLNGGATTTVTGSFTQRGELHVLTTPAVASQITLDGNPTDDWGMFTDVPTGAHTVCYGKVANYDPPACQSITVKAGALTTTTGTFKTHTGAPGQNAVGLLRVTQASPAVPAQITIKPGAGSPHIADSFGLNWLELAPGSYTVSFNHVQGWTEPAPQTITITSGSTTTVTVTFTQRGLLHVFTSPAVAGTISVDGIPRDDWGMFTDIPAGSHTVCFGAAAGFPDTPQCQTVTVNAGVETDVTGYYGPAEALAFGVQPSTTVAGARINPSPTVRILDANGNLINSSANVTLALGASGTNCFPATLLGTTTVAASGGIATFPDLSLDVVARGYVLSASSTGLTGAVSSAFDVTTGPAGTWSRICGMGLARSNQTATLLSNGKVLIVGGQSFSGFLAGAQLYDPVTSTWSYAGSMSIRRLGHTATLLSSGKVLVTGGETGSGGGALASAELYDPANGTWSLTGTMAAARVDHIATMLSNGKVLVAGGFDNSNANLASTELYDSASGSWSTTGSMAGARSSHTGTLLSSGKVLVAGGYVGGSPGLASTELYDPASETWATTASLAAGRSLHTATLLSNGKVLVAGGSANSSALASAMASAELYDPASATWSSTGSLAHARTYHPATLLQNGKVLVAGGLDVHGDLSSAELYDTASGTWSSTGNMVQVHGFHTDTLLSNGKVLAAGGEGSDAAELYSP